MSDQTLTTLSDLLNPEKIKDERAKKGSELLGLQEPIVQIQIFKSVVVEKKPISEVLSGMPYSEDERLNVEAALRRLILVGRPLAEKMKKEEQDARPSIDQAASTFSELLAELGDSGDPGMDVCTDLSQVVRIKQARYKALLKTALQNPNGHLLYAKAMQDEEDGLVRSLEKLFGLQSHLGIVEKKPDKLKVGLDSSFQQYLEVSDQRDRDAMARAFEAATEGFLQYAERKQLPSNDDVE